MARNCDDYCENSVNWRDDDGAVMLLGQYNTRKGKPQFEGGYCVLPFSVVKLSLKGMWSMITCILKEDQ